MKITPQLLKHIEGSPDQIAVLIKVIPSVMVSLEDVLVKKYNIKVVRRIASAGYISAIVDREKIAEIAKMPQVISVTHIPQVGLLQKAKASLEVMPALPYMKAKTAAEPTMLGEISDFLGITPLKKGGITGKNVIIGIVDSGVALPHPMLDGKINKEQYFVGTSPRDMLGHGSHVAGIAVGNRVTSPNGLMEGMAPDAKVINAKIFDQNTTSADICMQGLEYAAMNGASIISCSWGSSEHFEPFHDVIRTLKAKYGCLFVCASGNEGEPNSIVCPADSEDVIAVGSVSKTGIISEFSSRGPAYDGRIKPDLMGVGENVYSSYLTGGYEILSGTSMATPTISGGLACLMQLGKVNVSSVYGYASKGGVKDNTSGYGVPDFSKSRVQAIRAGLPSNLLMNLGIIPLGFILTKWAK